MSNVITVCNNRHRIAPVCLIFIALKRITTVCGRHDCQADDDGGLRLDINSSKRDQRLGALR